MKKTVIDESTRKILFILEISGAVFVSVCAIVLHFLYDISGNAIWAAVFSAVNESIWEHLKLSFFPMLIIAIIGYYLFGKKDPNYIKGNCIGIIFSLVFILFITFPEV